MSVQELVNIFSTLGLSRGDNVLVSSDIIRLLPHLVGEDRKALRSNKAKSKILNDIIDCLQELVGEEGTLLFPTYNWGFCHGETFDYRNTVGLTGILSNQALFREDFVRTKHPIYSFAVWGKCAEELANLENIDSFSMDSPFGWLYRNNGKNLSIDASIYFTFMHFVEECCGMTYRFVKNFTSKYIDKDGTESIRTYSMYVRDLKLNIIYNKEKYESFLQENKVMRCISFHDLKFGLTELSNAYPLLANDMLNNNSMNIIKSVETL